MRPPIRHHRLPPLGTALVAACAAAAAHAADVPPEVVASFTRRVQPLVINRCAAGACHGGSESPEPRFHRGVAGKSPDRSRTLENLATLLDTVGPARDPRPLAAFLAAGHPAAAHAPARRVPPLSTPERITLDRFLAEVRAAEGLADPADSGVVQVSAEVAEPAREPPNRFRALLDAAANPPALPPPQEPNGVIFKNDEPPAE